MVPDEMFYLIRYRLRSKSIGLLRENKYYYVEIAHIMSHKALICFVFFSQMPWIHCKHYLILLLDQKSQ